MTGRFYRRGMCALLVLGTALPVAAGELPYGVFESAQSMFLKGAPRKLAFSNTSTGHVVTYVFDDSGLVRERKTSGGLVAPYKLTVKRGRLVKFEESRADGSNTGDVRIILPRQFDEAGNLTYFSSQFEYARGVMRGKGQLEVTRVTYLPNAQLHEVFTGSARPADGPVRRYFEFADGRLTRHCWGDTAGPGCKDALQIVTYGPDGPLQDIAKLGTTTYVYQDGQLLSETRVRADGSPDTVMRYRDYQLDACGNWTSRRFSSEPDPAALGVHETRTIEYFRDCGPSR